MQRTAAVPYWMQKISDKSDKFENKMEQRENCELYSVNCDQSGLVR